MSCYDVAHIREQGQDMIIVPVRSSVGNMSTMEQNRIAASLEMCAHHAGLVGKIVLVWDDGFGRMGFLAPRPWHPFIESINLGFIAAKINRRLICG